MEEGRGGATQSLGLPLRRARHARQSCSQQGVGGGIARARWWVVGSKEAAGSPCVDAAGRVHLEPKHLRADTAAICWVFFFVFCDKAQLGGTTDNGQEREKDGGAGTWGVSGVREGRAVLLNSMHPTRSS